MSESDKWDRPTLEAVLRGLRSEDDSTQLRAIIACVEGMLGTSVPSTVDAIPVSEIEAEIAHIQQNGINLARYGGQDLDEGRCRELCAMYLREFISSEHLRKLIVQLGATSSATGETFASWIERELPRATGYERDLAETVWLGAIASRSPTILKDAERYQLMRANVGREIVASQNTSPGVPHTLRVNFDATGCERYTADGAVDFPATLDAILDDEARIRAAWSASTDGGAAT